MRRPLTREALRALMKALARSAPGGASARVYLVGGGSAVWMRWRDSTVDADLHGEPEAVFQDVQGIKERLGVNVEFVRPEDFVPPLEGSADRHVFIESVGPISFYHHDPYAQALSKIVRGFGRDLQDARRFVESGMVDADRLRDLAHGIPSSAYAKYPALTQAAVVAAVDDFVGKVARGSP